MTDIFASESQRELLSDSISRNLSWGKELGYEIYEHARVLSQKYVTLSGGVCKKDGSFISTTSFVEDLYDGSYRYDESIVVHKNCDAVFLGSWFPVYGHAITDSIKRLWFLFTQEYQDIQEKAKCSNKRIELVYVYLGGNLIDLPDYMKTMITAIGVDVNSLVRITEVTEYDNVIIPDNSLIEYKNFRYYTPQFENLVERICDYCRTDKQYPSKIYLTRTAINDGKDFGEKALEEIFEKKGYHIVAPEKLSFQEQVDMMQHCSSLVATEGSVSHNALFCREGTSVVVLRKANIYNRYSIVINNMKKLDVTYIEANHTIKSRIPWGGHFFLWSTKYLNQYLGEESKERSRWLSPLWYRYLWAYYKFEHQAEIQSLKRVVKKLLFWKEK